jgi:hypothetical protein
MASDEAEPEYVTDPGAHGQGHRAYGAPEPRAAESAVGDGRGLRIHGDAAAGRPASGEARAASRAHVRADDDAQGAAGHEDDAAPEPRAEASTPRARSVIAADDAPPVPATTSADLARQSQKARRRARDARAEKVALYGTIGAFVCVGLGVLLVINSGAVDAPSDTPRTTLVPVPGVGGAAKPEAARPALDETPDLPALRQLQGSGLTIVAEGLPEVLAVEGDVPTPRMAALETCRFAYGIWEFSPNRAFRFVTTCGALAGQQLVGAYEVDGSKVRMSPLSIDGVVLTSVFEVEKPSTMTTRAVIGGRHGLEIRQRITGIRPGLDIASFAKAYGPRNTVAVDGVAAPPTPGRRAAPRGDDEPAAPPPAPKKDPVEELLDP